jgi:hypothetical protein
LLLNRATLFVLCLNALFSIALIGCGKKAEVKPKPPIREVDPVQGEMEKLLQKQSVECENGISCPGGMAKIAVVDRDKLRFCTGFLVNSVTLATSSSCLTESLRISSDDSRCEKDFHVFFPRFGFEDQKRVGCKRILLSSPLIGKDPTLWRNDITYIELSEPVYRRSFRLSRQGIEDAKFVTLWKVDAQNDEVGIIRKEDCQAIQKSYVNPLAENEFSPVITLSGCEFTKGNTGGVVLGNQGKWRGIVSQPIEKTMDDFLRNSGLLIEPLAPILHVSNGACLPSVLDSDPVLERECFKDLDVRQVDVRRSEMLNADTPYQANRSAVQDQINAVRPYFVWTAQLIKNNSDNSYSVKIVPKCMNKVSTWIDQVGRGSKKSTYSMVLPDWKLILGFDRSSRLVSRMDESLQQKIFVQFSPKNAWNNNKTEVNVWRQGTQGDSYNLVPCTPLEEVTN